MRYIYSFLVLFFAVVFGNIATILLMAWLLWEYLVVK